MKKSFFATIFLWGLLLLSCLFLPEAAYAELTGSMERGNSCEAYQSVPVEAKMDGKTTVEITLTERKQA